MGRKILFISIHRPSRSPSQRFRFEQYLDSFANNGYQIKHLYHLNESNDKIYYSSGHFISKTWIVIASVFRLFKELYFQNYDIVFVQREAFMIGTSFFERQFSKKAKLIFDFDDSIWLNQTGELKSKNKKFYFLKNPLKTEEIIKVSHLVFAGNNYLGNYASRFNENVKIVPTTIDTDKYLLVKKEHKKKICIGWSGSFSTIIHFEYIIEALKKVKMKYANRVYFKVIGDSTFKNDELFVEGIAWDNETEIEDLSEIDIGIMPLPNDKWTEGKCGLKGLQYMGLGIPCIMSPVGVNKDIIKDGANGFLAYSEAEWVDKISLLVESEDLRRMIGLKGRETVVDYYSVNAIKDSYLNYFSELLQN